MSIGKEFGIIGRTYIFRDSGRRSDGLLEVEGYDMGGINGDGNEPYQVGDKVTLHLGEDGLARETQAYMGSKAQETTTFVSGHFSRYGHIGGYIPKNVVANISEKKI